jgi:glycosyltransferase involved in cell wall biosynthesis
MMFLSESSEQKRLKVLLVAPTFHSAIGILARYIVKNCAKIEFFMMDVSDADYSSAEFVRLVNSVDIVHWLVNLSTAQFADPDLPAKLPCPSVASIHHLASGETDKVRAASQADMIHVSCREWLDYVTAHTKTPARLASYPIDLARFARNRRRARHPHLPLRIGFLGVGSLFKRKRLDILLEALAQLEKVGEKFQLWAQGLYWPDVVVPGEPIHLFNFVPFHQSWRMYADFDVYICSSDVEGGPLTVLEALASGVPVISTPVGLAPEVLAYGGGLLVNKAAPAELAAALAGLMQDRTLYQRLQSETLSAVEQFAASVEEQYLALYTETIETWQAKRQTKWIGKPAVNQWAGRAQRFRAIGRDLFKEARNMKVLRQPAAAMFALLQMCNPLRFFE